MFSTIMVPLDGSEAAESALPVAIGLLGSQPGELLLVRALDIPEFVTATRVEFSTLHDVFDQQQAEAEVYLQRVATPLRAQGLIVNTRVPHGSPPSESLLQLAREQRVDVVVMTSHGRTGLARFFLGSVAEKVARHAPCPVLIVRGTRVPAVSK